MKKFVVVKHKTTGNVYAISSENIDSSNEEYVRDLKPSENRFSFPHKANSPLGTKPGSSKSSTSIVKDTK